MARSFLWTKLGARLQLVNKKTGGNWNWIFLPGGPGLGSESLSPLTDLLKLPGFTWHLDLPGDGSNQLGDFSNWQEALIEATDALPNVILVAHSTGGMYALATPALQSKIIGLVLMDSAPDASWQQFFAEYLQKNPIHEMEELHRQYSESPNNEVLKKMTLLSAPYLFTKEGMTKDISFLESVPYNYKSCDWSASHFDATYKGQWVPNNMPTLIFAGDQDCITPLSSFKVSSQFKSSSILIREIPKAGHFPWIENPQGVVEVFEEYCHMITNGS